MKAEKTALLEFAADILEQRVGLRSNETYILSQNGITTIERFSSRKNVVIFSVWRNGGFRFTVALGINGHNFQQQFVGNWNNKKLRQALSELASWAATNV